MSVDKLGIACCNRGDTALLNKPAIEAFLGVNKMNGNRQSLPIVVAIDSQQHFYNT